MLCSISEQLGGGEAAKESNEQSARISPSLRGALGEVLGRD